MAISETSYPYPVMTLSSDILTLSMAAFFVQQPPKKGKGSRGSFKL